MRATPRTIGQVLELVREEFPDLSVSKLRYLESEGLITPDRDQPSGYRRFNQADIDRLLFVLRAQRDRYLPLKVIREELDAMDRGDAVPARTKPSPEPSQPAAKSSSRGPRTQKPPLNRRQILAETELSEGAFIELERLQLVSYRPGTHLYGQEMVAIARAAKRLGDLGIDLRQLRVIQQAAVAEAALAQQVLGPYQRRGTRPAALTADIYRLVLQAHIAYLHSQMTK
ncbi:MAG: hypothetical protein CSA64_01660 [Arachnia propionica]|nr:MAG: hypothetical protein CSA64_01660 [Arachnia propionica]